MMELKTIWQPINGKEIVLKPVDRFKIECLEDDISKSTELSHMPWLHKPDTDKVQIVVYDLELARMIIKQIQSHGFVAKRDWVE